MAYTITSDRLDCAKAVGDSITSEELLALGANIEALVAGEHITDGASRRSTPAPTEGASN